MIGLRLNHARCMGLQSMWKSALNPSAVRPVTRHFLRPLGTIPQPPGFIVGTVNDAVPIPPIQKTKGSYHWSFEKVITVGIVPLAVAPFFTGSLSPVLDATLGSLLILHSQTGLESCILDYIPRRTYGRFHTFAVAALYTGSIVAFIGLYEYETKDVGLIETVRKVWNS